VTDGANVSRMADVINLNRFRKNKAREDAERQAEENRVRFGRTKAQKQRDAAEAEEAQRRLERLRREAPEAPEPPEKS
jgi:vacuolar-type H+-ATPase subunit C/Vma6